MFTYIVQELKARGVAQVIVTLKAYARPSSVLSIARGPPGMPANAAGPEIEKLACHFVASERSQTNALFVAAAAGRPLRAAVRAGRAKLDVAIDAGCPPPGTFYPNLGVLLGNVTWEGLAGLRANRQVESVVGVPVFSLIRPRRVAAARLTKTVTWGIKAMSVPLLWKQGLTGKDVLIGHLDTGVDGKHPALKGAIASFTEFDDFGREVKSTLKPFDSDEHGTHTAATIAGRPVRGKHVGVAPGALLASAVSIEGGDVVARVLGGMDWAVGQGVRILSMSLGFRGYTDAFLAIVQLLRARQILPIFAVGNEGPGTSRSPGNFAEALSVGAFDLFGNVADFSSSQRFERMHDSLVPDLVAPGVDVISAKPGGGYQVMDGSSMAAPHVAGLAALLMEAKPDKSADDVEEAIFASCKLRRGMIPERANRGVPNAVQALAML